MPEFSQQAKQIFNEARKLPAEQRPSYVEANCAGDADLRAQIEALLGAYSAAGSFLESPTFEPADRAGPDSKTRSAEETPGTIIGRYKILQPIGEGGFGRVFMAEQTEPVVRKVALKIIKLGMDTRQVIARFEAERQALAMMDHPNIAKVLDAGATPEGRPFFVMELVRGEPITDYCDKNNLDVPQRLELFSQVCNAVQHAHQKGIIHRDIKPTNVLVTMADGKPVPKVIDFGIAKATSARLTEKTLFTEFRHLIGTPAYMSPEQAEASGVDIDTRSDIYSLGVLLYELLTGTTPFDAKRLHSAAYAEIQRIIREEEPPKPSTRLSTLETLPAVAAHRHTEPAKLSRTIRGDLDWIVMKCLEKDRTRRYETAESLTSDVRRHMEHEPVLAGPPSAGYRIKKFVRRHRLGVLAGSAVSSALVLGMIGTGWGMVRAERARLAEEAEAKKANTVVNLIEQMLTSADPHQNKGPNYTVRQLLDEFNATLGNQLKDQPEVEYTIRSIIGKAYLGLGKADAAEPHLQAALALAQGLGNLQLQAALADQAKLRHDQGDFHEAVRLIEQAGEISDIKSDFVRLTALSDYFTHLGRYGEAEALLREVQLRIRESLGDEHPDTLNAIGGLGLLLHTQGKYVEAEPYLRETLEKCRRVLGEEHPDTLRSIHNLGLLLYDQGKLAEAEACYREALEKARRVLGEEHPDTLNLINSTGALLKRQGKLAEAESYLRTALEGTRRVLGDEHPNTLTSISQMGGLLRAQGKHAEAEAYFGEALEKARRVLGEEHPRTLRSINNLGLLLHDQGKLAEAEPYYREALEKARRVLGEDHPNTLNSVHILGSLLRDQGRYTEAEPYYREALEKARRVLGEDHPKTLASIAQMGSLLHALGRYAEAEPYYREALEKARRVLGGEHPNTLASISQMGGFLRDQRRYAEAEPYYREVVEKTRRALGEEHPNTLASVYSMGSLLYDQGKLAEAEPYYREVLEKARRVLGQEHPKTIATVHNLGCLLRNQGRYSEAEPLFREAVERAGKRFTGEHPETATYEHHLAEVLTDLGKVDEALALALPALDRYERHPDWPPKERAHARDVALRALIASGQAQQAGRLIAKEAAEFSESRPMDEAGLCGTLAAGALLLLERGTREFATEAEPFLRKCLDVRQRILPDDHPDAWRRCNTMSLLGEALALQGRFAEAEPLLIESERELVARAGQIPAEVRDLRVSEARRRLVKLYEAWEKAEPGRGHEAKARKWQDLLDGQGASSRPSAE